MTTNDSRILELKKFIEKQKEELKSIKTFAPITNCVITLWDKQHNINVANIDTLNLLLVNLTMMKEAAKKIDVELIIGAFSVEDWISDISNRILTLNKKSREAKLKAAEATLTNLLSEDKKTELEIDNIASMLKGI